ncbi:pyridoxamine 5'-phosphate oxidase family protein [Collinsella sp. zg1085]|uniref:pyridoxamine 5'-phosphate oxidase family protein n=1 Tax=Collinsella sp. zg1085 TaxID=2844380 RepID=UPI001C0B0E55|nr:pyridoxamine 5'-phosphate oxidase family protein [Collinsella sp. zg1085]QWT17225.1 pyridoxamine 5'-phosphate oxidase family protein [Collinsella sp. zg1085]
MRAMRRKNRAVTQLDDLHAIVSEARILRIAVHDEDGLYIVPLDYGFDWDISKEQPQLSFWMHSASEGRKVDAFRAHTARNEAVAFELDIDEEIISGKFACAYSRAYRSIIGSGMIVEVTDEAEKLHGLQQLMEHVAPNADVPMTGGALARVSVWRLDVQTMSGKARSAS